MTTLYQVVPALNAHVNVNDNFTATSAAGMYGRSAPTTSALTWGFYGGRGFGNTIADGTVALTASTTNYVVANRSSGVVSVSTSLTNWNDTVNYCRLHLIVTGASSITTATDYRELIGGINTPFTGGTLASSLNEAPAVTLASAGTLNIGAAAANSISVTGATTITAFDTIAAGAKRELVFAGALTLTHNSTSLILPTGSSIATAAGDVADFVSLGAGNWRCVNYMRASGNSLAGAAFTGGTLSGSLNEAPTVTIASSGTVAIGAAAGNTISVTGTTTITAFDTIAAGAMRRIVFAGALTLTHSGTALILPGAASITTASGDVAEFISLGSGNWRCTNYSKVSGTAVVTGGSLANFTESVSTAAPNATIPAVRLLATNAATDVDAVFSPKGAGAVLAQTPDNGTAGGNKRGTNAVDNQTSRFSATSVASGVKSCIPGGSDNTASGANSFAMGLTTSATAASAVAFGERTTADAAYSEATGLYSQARGIYGAQAWGSGRFTVAGDAQARRFVLRASTPDATLKIATTDQAAAGTTNQIVLGAQGVFKIRGQVVAINAATADAVSFDISATAKRVSNTVSIVGTSTITQQAADSGLTACAITLTADATNKAINVNVTGIAATTIRWVASIESVEVL